MADVLIRGMEMPKERSLWLCIKTDGTVYNIKPGGIGTAGAVGTAVTLPDRTCRTCAFGGTPSYKMPCSSCHPTYEGRTNWTEKQKKQTNADKFFRNATDEQIARFLAASQAEILEVFCKKLGYPEAVAETSTADTVANAWIDWLGKEAPDDEAAVESFAGRS